MINPEFKAETDKLIRLIEQRGIKLENGNMLVAKVKVDRVSSGGIVFAETAAEREDYKNGFARILALPPLGENDPAFKVGDYILHSHEARYHLYPQAIREILNTYVEDKFVFAVQDNEVICHINQEHFA